MSFAAAFKSRLADLRRPPAGATSASAAAGAGAPAARRRPINWAIVVGVTIVAALIWLFAESASLTQGQQQIRVTFVDPLGENVIRARNEGWSGAVNVRLQGPASVVQRAPVILAEGVVLALGQSGVADIEGEQRVDLLTALRGSARFQETGLTIVDVDPATVSIEVESIVELADVEVEPALEGLRVAEPPIVTPARVRVRAPRTVIEALRALPGGPAVNARLPSGAVETLQPGVQQTIESRLSLPGALGAARDSREVRIEPPTAQITVRVESRVASFTLASAPVWPATPPTPDAERWEITIHPEDALLKDVTVTGPTAAIAQIREGRFPIIALLALSSDELESPPPSKAVFWRLPEGASVDGGDRVVRFTVERREEPAQE